MYGSVAAIGKSAHDAEIEKGLNRYFMCVFNKMALGLCVTGVIAYFSSIYLLPLMSPIATLMLILFPLPFALIMAFGINRLSIPWAILLFYAYACTMGLSMSVLFVLYTTASIIQVFFIAAGTFAGASAYGYITKSNLARAGNVLIMLLIGVLISTFVNMFLMSGIVNMAISIAAVAIFTGLTAYDTQQLKQEYLTNGQVYGFDSAEKSSIYGAFIIYLNFINIMIHLLAVIGDRK